MARSSGLRKHTACVTVACVLASAEALITKPWGDGPIFPESTRWRLANLDEVVYGWTMAEMKLFSDAACTKELTAEGVRYSGQKLSYKVIYSGEATNMQAEKNFDGKTFTAWRAQCHICAKEEAWIGVEFNWPVKIMCAKFWQWNTADYKADEVALQRWHDDFRDPTQRGWRDVLQQGGLLSSSWQTIRFVTCDKVEPPERGRVEVSNHGYFPSMATYGCNGIAISTGARQAACGIDGAWGDEPPRCWAAIHLIAVIALFVILECIGCIIYVRSIMSKKPQFLDESTFIPPDSLNHWFSPILHPAHEDPYNTAKTFPCFCCCRIADTWQAVGKLGFSFGLFIIHVFFLCLPCIGAYFRGLIRRRFYIKGGSFDDLAMWCCCWPFAAIQEAKLVDAMCQIAFEEEAARRASEERKQIEEAKEKAAEAAANKPKAIEALSTVIGKKDVANHGGAQISKQHGQVIRHASTLESLSQK